MMDALPEVAPVKLSHLFIVCMCVQGLFAAIGLALIGVRVDLADRLAELTCPACSP
jgi:hypothetical protein